MTDQIENAMVVNWWWDESEYGVPSKARMKRERQAYEAEEREDREDGINNSLYL
ncbi:MAG: hypothetical protein K2G89_03410 [Lachnospiraceae bacterium]|nr:hypothetical protein [Lachnospiraceae bacterium]